LHQHQPCSGAHCALACCLMLAGPLRRVARRRAVLQEEQAQARWGAEPAYQQYRARTNLLLPIPSLTGGDSKAQ